MRPVTASYSFFGFDSNRINQTVHIARNKAIPISPLRLCGYTYSILQATEAIPSIAGKSSIIYPLLSLSNNSTCYSNLFSTLILHSYFLSTKMQVYWLAINKGKLSGKGKFLLILNIHNSGRPVPGIQAHARRAGMKFKRHSRNY